MLDQEGTKMTVYECKSCEKRFYYFGDAEKHWVERGDPHRSKSIEVVTK